MGILDMVPKYLWMSAAFSSDQKDWFFFIYAFI